MSKRKRTLIGIAVVELLLAGLWYYLHMRAVNSPTWSPDGPERIGRTMGMAMGVILGLAPLLYLLARSNDLKDEKKRRSGG
jgi:hypothetical protein